MFQSKKILVVAAHPDDELLGCGATLHRLINEFGCKVKVVILGEGLTSRDDARDTEKRKAELEQHRACIQGAKNKITYQELSIHQIADNRFDSVDLLDIIKIVESEKQAFKPDWIFTHHGGDLNIDHRRTFEAVLTATRPVPGENVKGVLCFETFSSTEWSYSLDVAGFKPNFFMSFSKESLKAKLEAMEEYKFEKRSFPHPRSVEALEAFAKSWGAKVGTEYAESFYLVRYTL